MTFDYQAARLTMVESQVRTSDVTDLHVQDAMRLAPRESLCPAGKQEVAYADAEIEYAPGLFLLRPRAIGKLLQALKPRPHEAALAIAGALQLSHGAQADRLRGGRDRRRQAAPAKGKYQLIVVEERWTRRPPPGARRWPKAAAWP